MQANLRDSNAIVQGLTRIHIYQGQGLKIEYMRFDSRSKEAFNTAQLGAVLARSQEYLLPLRFDSNGADMLAYNPATNATRAIQIKARVTVDARYSGKNLWIAFPHWVNYSQQDWYVVPHDTLVQFWGAKKVAAGRAFSAGTPSKQLLKTLAGYRVGSVALG
jgi:hypothetical protein